MFERKRKIAWMVCLVFVLTASPAASFASSIVNEASEGGIITPYWTGVAQVYSNFICENGQANPQIDVAVDSNKVDKVNFNGKLLQYKNGLWTTVTSWNTTKPVSLTHCVFNEYYSISSGYNYKFVTTVKAYKGSTLIDTISIDSVTRWY